MRPTSSTGIVSREGTRLNQVASNGEKSSVGFAYFIAALPPLFWAGNFLLARMYRGDIPPLQMSFWRWVIAMVILLAMTGPAVRANSALIRKELPMLALLGLLGVTAFSSFVYTALHYTTVINGSLVNSMLPVVTFILALLILGDRISLRQGLGVVLAMLGAVVIITSGNLGQVLNLGFNRGDLLVFCGTSCWALYTVLLKWRPTQLPPMVFLAVTVSLGVLFHIPFLIWEIVAVGTFTPTWDRLAVLVYFAVFASILAYVCWGRAVAAIGPGRTGTFMYMLPAFSAALAITILGEHFELFHAVGVALIFGGIILVTKPVKSVAVA